MSNTQGNDTYTPDKTEEREAPSRSLSAVLAGWPMSPFQFLFDRRTKRYTVILAVMLAVTIILSTVLFIGGRSIYFSFTPKPQEEIKGDGVASEMGDFPYADGAGGNVLLSCIPPMRLWPTCPRERSSPPARPTRPSTPPP